MDTYTGQYSYTADFGLMYYNARWYDPALGRFAQADTIVPGGVQGLDRYAYVNNNPLRFTDPSGHIICMDAEFCYMGLGSHPGSGTGGLSGGHGNDDKGDDGDNPDDSLLDFVDEDFNTDKCEYTVYECGGNSIFGYVFNPITGEIVTWNNGTDYKILNSMNSGNQTLTTNLTLFISEVDSYTENYAAAINSTIASGFASTIFAGTLFLIPKVTPLEWGIIGLEGVAVIVTVGYVVYSGIQLSNNIKSINKLFTGILLNSP